MKKHFRKLASVMLALSLIVTMLPICSTNNNVSAAAHTLQNPSKDSSGDTVWDCIWFGNYPQAEVIPSGTYTALDNSLVQDGDTIISDSIYNQLRNATGWNSNGDITISGNKYRRIRKSDATYGTSGDSNYYNWSDSTTYHYFKYEPIKWRVLNVNGNDAFLLADKGLDDQRYNTEYTGVTWETSTIRSWLNGYGASGNAYGTDYSSKNFIGTAFNNSEQSAIKTTSVINNDNIDFETNGGNNTNDKVFLLSESEVYTDSAISYGFDSDYSKDDEARRSKSSTYAKAMGTCSYIDTDYWGNCWWWLRSPGYYSFYAAGVDYFGCVYGFGIFVDNCYDAVRPALHLNLSSSNLYSYAGTVCSDGTENEEGGNSPVEPEMEVTTSYPAATDFLYHDNGDGTCYIYDYIGTSENVVIPESINGLTVTKIDSGTFGNIDLGENGGISDSQITSMSIPKTITDIGEFAFKNCSSLEEIKVDTQNTEYKTVDGVLYTSDGTVLICYPAKRASSSISISENVKEIKAYAFNFVTNLKDVYYESNVFTWSAILIGESNEAIEKANLHAQEIDWGSEFTLGRDNNSYGHYSTNGMDRYGNYLNNAGFVGEENNDITRESYEKLTVNATFAEKAKIICAARKPWNGSCYGIAATMCLNYSNELDLNSLLSNSNSYYELELPYTNHNFINAIKYYQLAQQLSNYGVKSNSYFTCDLYNSDKTMSLSTFLKKLVNVCQNEETAIFGMLTKDSGHAIVACGCYTDEANDRYIIRLYDENTVIFKKDMGSYAYMEIPMDFSDYIVHGDVTEEKEDLKTLFCVDVCNNATISTPFSKLMTINARQNQKKMYVSVDASSAFKLINDKGESLEYDGTYYSGDMEVYNIQPIVNTTEISYIYEIDYSESFTYISSNETDSFDLYDDESYYAVEVTGMDTANINFDEGISLFGEDIKFNVVVDNEDSEKTAITEVIGKAIDDVSINDREGIKVNSENIIEDVSIMERDIVDSDVILENQNGKNIEYHDGKIVIDGEEITDNKQETTTGGVETQTTSNSETLAEIITKENTETTTPKMIDTTTKQGENNTKPTVEKTTSKSETGKKPKSAKIKKIKKAKKSLKITWTKVKGVKGYQLQFSTSSKFKKAKKITVKKAKIISKTIKKLKAKKKYYVRIRTYIIVNGKKKYSNWSKKKGQKTE